MARPRKKNATASDDSSSAGAGAEPKPKRARKCAARESPSSSQPQQQQQRTSAYRGVTRHRWTGRFEAHLWDKDAWNHEARTKKKKGKQGAYDEEEAAARAHDLAALKYWGPGTVLNFPLCSYEEELKEMEGQTREEYIGSVRRKSSGFSRGVSKYRGVARHHHNGRWEARIGRVLGNKYLYLGTYSTQEEAAVAYDIAAIEHRGLNAVTNFDISHYVNWHRRRRLLGEDDGLDAAEMGPIQLSNDITEHAPVTISLDETVVAAAAAFHDGERHDVDSYIAQLPGDQVRMPVHKAPTSSALDLILQSPKFKEMMEQVSAAAAATESNTSSPSPSPSMPSCSPSLSQLSPEERQPELSGGASSAPCSFPDDVQTYFECDDGMSFAFAEVDTFLFGDLGAYAAPMFQCDLGV
ncbi:hypothetical protein EJB05_48880, partial [Eragrostis curvula]